MPRKPDPKFQAPLYDGPQDGITALQLFEILKVADEDQELNLRKNWFPYFRHGSLLNPRPENLL
jgi:hypothetical protein